MPMPSHSWSLPRRCAFVACLFGLVPSACGYVEEPGVTELEEAEPEPEPWAPDDVQLEGCTEALEVDEVWDALQVAYDFRTAAHGSLVSGSLVDALAGALDAFAIADDPSESALPEGFVWDGHGTYVAQSPAGFERHTIRVQLFLTEDYGFGQAGDRIEPNLFEMSSYLVDARTRVVGDTWEERALEVEHGGPGPLAELVGFDESTPSPLLVDLEGYAEIQARFDALELRADIELADTFEVADVEYVLEVAQTAVGPIRSGAVVDLALVSATGLRPSLEQALGVESWRLAYYGGYGTLAGDVRFTVEGGPFDYEGVLRYLSQSTAPSLEIRCPGASR